MADSYHFYFAAAQTLWNSSLGRLQTMSKEADHAAVRRAAERTLQLKARFMTPEEFTEERAAISKLAGALFADRDFTVDVALEVAGKPRGPEPKQERSRRIGQPRSRSGKVRLWFAVAAGSILLGLDVLATAGVPVPTPIGVLIDRFTSDRPPYLPPQPFGDPHGHLHALPGAVDEALPGTTSSARAPTTKPRPDVRRVRASTKNVNHANGRKKHQAQGREQHQATGKKLHEANGRSRVPKGSPEMGRAIASARRQGRGRASEKADRSLGN